VSVPVLLRGVSPTTEACSRGVACPVDCRRGVSPDGTPRGVRAEATGEGCFTRWQLLPLGAACCTGELVGAQPGPDDMRPNTLLPRGVAEPPVEPTRSAAAAVAMGAASLRELAGAAQAADHRRMSGGVGTLLLTPSQPSLGPVGRPALGVRGSWLGRREVDASRHAPRDRGVPSGSSTWAASQASGKGGTAAWRPAVEASSTDGTRGMRLADSRPAALLRGVRES
jgi:hypothetical protein